MNEKLLDLSVLTEEQFAAVKRGFDAHITSTKLSYFGQIGKSGLAEMCKEFNYTDMRSFKKGVAFAAVVIGAGSMIKKYNKKKSQPEQVTVIENTEE